MVTRNTLLLAFSRVCSSQQAETHGRLGPALKRDTTMAVFVSLCAFAGQGEQRVKDNSTQKPEKRKRTHGTKDAVPSERGHSEDRETSEQRFSDNAASVAPAQ